MADLIDREKLKEAMCEQCASFEEEGTMSWPCPNKEVCLAMDTVDEQPAVDPVKHGMWRKQNNPCYSPFDGSDQYWYYCSRCGEPSNAPYDYCPQCGTRCDE